MQNFTFEQIHMSTRVTISVWSNTNKSALTEKIDRAFAIFQKLEDRFSIFRENSELMQLNARSGQAVTVSPLLFATIQYACVIAQETNGIFNPCVGCATIPHAQKTLTPQKWSAITFDANKSTITLPQGSMLDLNSIVKGMAIDMALAELGTEENVLIEAGGDLRVQGLPPEVKTWDIGIRNPHSPEKICTVVHLKNQAICTTGGYFRSAKTQTEGRIHLFNPTKKETTTASISVIAKTAREADAYSTAAYFMPIDEAIAFVERHDGASCLIIDEDKTIFMSPRMKSIFLSQSYATI